MTDPVTQRLGIAIKVALIRQGRTQSELADALGMSRSQLSRRNAGQTPWDIAELTRAAKWLGVSVVSLIDDGPERATA